MFFLQKLQIAPTFGEVRTRATGTGYAHIAVSTVIYTTLDFNCIKHADTDYRLHKLSNGYRNFARPTEIC